MVGVTERAAKELKSKLDGQTTDPEQGLRLLPTPERKFVLVVDYELSGDRVVEYEGRKVLLVGIEYYRALEGRTIDCHDTQKGPVLFMR